MFMSNAPVYLEALQQHAPDIYSVCEAELNSCERDMDFLRISVDSFKLCPSDSIDHADVRMGDIRESYANILKAQEVLVWKLSIKLENGMKDLLP